MSDKQRFLVRFWGVRGSYPTPGTTTVRYGGNTSCVEIEVGSGSGHTLIFDAGSGIIGLGSHLQKRVPGNPLDMSLFITHGHGDHLIGFPFFEPLFNARTSLHIFGPQLLDYTIEHLVTQLMSPPYFPVDVRTLPSRRSFHTIADEHCIWWNGEEVNPIVDTKMRAMKHDDVCVAVKFTESHPQDGALMYRIEYDGRRVVYATDVEWQWGCDDSTLAFIEGADVLIHDAQFTKDDYQQMKQGYGHSTIEMAVATARAAHVHELVLFHHSPTYNDDQLDDMEAVAQSSFTQTRSAFEGMEIDLLKYRNKQRVE